MKIENPFLKFNPQFSVRIKATTTETFFKDAFDSFYQELKLHLKLFPKSMEYIFNYNERAYLSMFCHSYLKSQVERLNEILIIQEYSTNKSNKGYGRVDALITDKKNTNAYLIEAKVWPNKITEKEKAKYLDKTIYKDWEADYLTVKSQLDEYVDGELLNPLKMVLIFGPISNMNKYYETYKDYKLISEDPTDFYFLIAEDKLGLEIYGKVY